MLGQIVWSSTTVVEACARTAHEANRAYCFAIGESPDEVLQLPWALAPDWHRSSIINGVNGVLAGNGPKENHESWLKEKEAAGWKYGPVKNFEKKEHPCFVAYEDLPAVQQAKDLVFTGVVRAMAHAFGVEPQQGAIRSSSGR